MNNAAQRKTLLLVDDDDDVRCLIEEVIEDMGFRVISVRSGQEALFALELHQPHAMLCDINMPEMNGVDLLLNIRAMGSKIPFIFLTGYESQDYFIKALNLGANEFLTKPIPMKELQDKVAKTVEIGSRQKKRKSK